MGFLTPVIGALGGTGAVIGAGASLVGGLAQSRSADRAADAQTVQSAQIRADLAPYRDAGQRGLDAYLGRLGFTKDGYQMPAAPDLGLAGLSRGFQASPGYAYTLAQGQKEVQNSASARGNLHSGATQLELLRHRQGTANQDYWNYVNANRQGFQDNYNIRQQSLSRLEALAGAGAQAATQTGQFGANAATNAANIQLQGAGAMAGGLAGAANAVNSGLLAAQQNEAYRQGRGPSRY